MDENTILKISQLVVDVVFAVSLAFIISYTFFAQVLQQGFSMAPYINDRSVVLTNRLYRNVLPLNRNDVIAFYVNGQESIKRIYGMPGETITISNGNLYVNDIQLENEDLKNSLSSNIDQNVKLGDDEYYVLGDNLDSSKDSRASDVGNISKKNIIGKPTPILFEEKEVLGVENADAYLSHMYGDYLTIPKDADQRQHEFYYLDFERPYKDFDWKTIANTQP